MGTDHVVRDGHSRCYRRDRELLRRGRQPEENISRARTVVSPRFLYLSSLMEKRYLAMQMWLCEDKLKRKTAHFRLPSASQKRACLSSLSQKDTLSKRKARMIAGYSRDERERERILGNHHTKKREN